MVGAGVLGAGVVGAGVGISEMQNGAGRLRTVDLGPNS